MSAPPRPEALPALLAAAQQVAGQLPPTEKVEVTWRGPEGVRVHFELAGSLDVPTQRPPPAALSETEKTILDALAGDRLTGEEIASRTGYAFDGWFRGQLAAMRRRGLLSGERGESGYSAAVSAQK